MKPCSRLPRYKHWIGVQISTSAWNKKRPTAWTLEAAYGSYIFLAPFDD